MAIKYVELTDINPTCAASVERCGLAAIESSIAGETYYQFLEGRNSKNIATAQLTQAEAFWFMQGIWCARNGQ